MAHGPSVSDTSVILFPVLDVLGVESGYNMSAEFVVLRGVMGSSDQAPFRGYHFAAHRDLADGFGHCCEFVFYFLRVLNEDEGITPAQDLAARNASADLFVAVGDFFDGLERDPSVFDVDIDRPPAALANTDRAGLKTCGL